MKLVPPASGICGIGRMMENWRKSFVVKFSSQTLALSAASGSVGDCSSASFDDVISSSF